MRSGLAGRRLVPFAALVLAACVVEPVSFPMYWKEGATPARQLRDTNECEVRALAEVPRALTTSTTPVYTTPTTTECETSGDKVTCVEYGGQTYGGDVVTTDLNEDLRGRVYGQCMTDRRYRSVVFPACTPEQAAGGVIARGTLTLPASDSILCMTASGYVLR